MKDEQAIPKSPQPADNQHPQAENGLLLSPKYDIKEASKLLAISPSKLRELIRDGEIPVLMIDGKYLLLEQDLETFLLRHYGPMTQPNPPKPNLPPLPSDIAESDLLRWAG